jgi:hypothetical protein
MLLTDTFIPRVDLSMIKTLYSLISMEQKIRVNKERKCPYHYRIYQWMAAFSKPPGKAWEKKAQIEINPT